MPEVELSWSEMRFAAEVGAMRRVSATRKSRGGAHGYEGNPDPWVVDIEGAGAELAVAKVMGCFWNMTIGHLDTEDGDVFGGLGPEKWQVRSTLRRDGSLLLHPTDDDAHRFFLVVGRMPRLSVVGWMLGRDGKSDSYWRENTGRPAFFVPQAALQPIQ